MKQVSHIWFNVYSFLIILWYFIIFQYLENSLSEEIKRLLKWLKDEISIKQKGSIDFEFKTFVRRGGTNYLIYDEKRILLKCYF